jgi:hypothetical protein
MIDIPKFFTSATFALLLLGCVDSPLLHHANAQKSDPDQKNECPLAFARFDACGAIEWRTMPTNEEKGAFQISFWNSKTGSASGPYVDPGKTVSVKLWMPDMGHGSSPVKITAALDANGAPVPGRYHATEVYFVMGGTWEIWVQLRDGAVVLEEAKIDLSIE